MRVSTIAMSARLVLFALFGILAGVMGFSLASWEFWTLLLIMTAVMMLARIETKWEDE